MTERTGVMLKRVRPGDLGRAIRPPVDGETLRLASEIVESVRAGGESAVRAYAERFGERGPGELILLGRAAMSAALETLDAGERGVLERTAERIRVFAQAQRDAVRPVDVAVPGGRAGHDVLPVRSAGCYAPAGRYPLPSSVLMTAVTARVAGCERVVTASPGAHPVMLAAAAIAGADEFLALGGAHGVAAMAFGFEGFARCDVISGPGNKWVTAAKQLVSGVVGIDMLAGPSELLVVADTSADAELVARDLLAQAEHDADAVPMLVCTSDALAEAVDAALGRQLGELETREVGREALRNGFVCVAESIDEAIEIASEIAAEHLEVMTADADGVASRIRNAGGVFVGASSAEVFGDYGIGPNHTLPTGGTARFRSGLSVMAFLRLRTWLRVEDDGAPGDLIDDVAALASMEGLAGHRASAMARGRPG